MIGIFITGFILGTVIGGGMICWLSDYLDQKRRTNNRLRDLETGMRNLEERREHF